MARRVGDIYTARKEAMTPLKTNLVRGIVWLDEKRVGGPILQTDFGGSKQVPYLFDDKFWKLKLAPGEKAVMKQATMEEWKALADKWAETQPKRNPLASKTPDRFKNKARIG